MDTFKQEVYKAFSALQAQRQEHLQNVLDDLFDSAKNETKSTAGDKHETALAHLQIEQQKTRQQLGLLQEQTAVLNSINPSLEAPAAVYKGSLVKTEKQYFFIAGGLGKIAVGSNTVIAISHASPLGMRLMGKIKNDVVEMNNIQYCIENIY